MGDDFLKELGHLSVASRLKRISDKMIHSARGMYKQLDLEIEPNWYLIFKLLNDKGELSVTQIANFLQMAHPSIISIVNKMLAAGYLQSKKCDKDRRKQLLALSPKSVELLPKLERIWQASEQGVVEMMGDHNLLPILDHIDQKLAQKTFMDMTLENINQDERRL